MTGEHDIARRDSDKRRKVYRSLSVYGTYGTMGFELAAALVIPILGGMYLDKRWDIAPWLTITGVFLGFATAFRIVMKYLAMMKKEDAERKAANGKGDPP